MVKCLECGKELPRLQWTHFKYNCTGKFANGKEYCNAYPGAKLVSDDIAKTTAVTLANLIKKYGEIDGAARWEQYRKRQAYSNSFEYKHKQYGWSKQQFDEFNAARAQTLDNMIRRYGEFEGATKWEQYCARQAYTNTKDYFVSKYGKVNGVARYLEINNKKAMPHRPELLAQVLDITVDQATDIILSRQHQFFTSNLEQEFTNLIEQQLGTLDYISSRNPYGKWSKLLGTYVIYDIKHQNCIIEFNGDYWHANPAIYTETAKIRGKTALEIRNRDMLKLQTAHQCGLRTLVVWESEFKADKLATVNKAVKWILQEQQ